MKIFALFRKWREARFQRAQALNALRKSHPWLFRDRWSPEEQRMLESRKAPLLSVNTLKEALEIINE